MGMNDQITIKLKKINTIKIGIIDENGKDTGEYLEFNLNDTDLLLKYQEAIEQLKANKNALKMSFALINKKQDHSGKNLLSSQLEEKLKAFNTFMEKEMAAYDMFLGKDGCKKILNGKKPYYEMFTDIDEMIQPILPMIKKGWDDLENRLINKYVNVEENNVLK